MADLTLASGRVGADLACASEARARLSGGISEDVIYRMVASAIGKRHSDGGTLVDIGCGGGNLWPHTRSLFDRYVGVDAVKYDSFPPDAEFHQADLNSAIGISSATADVVACVETIEHLENPRALMRELVRVAKPGGWVIVTTPNQLSLLSKLCFVLKDRFVYFQDVHYPAHITSLLEIDLRRIASECALSQVSIEYSGRGRVVFTPWHYPAGLSRLWPRRLSDNVLMAGRRSLIDVIYVSRAVE